MHDATSFTLYEGFCPMHTPFSTTVSELDSFFHRLLPRSSTDTSHFRDNATSVENLIILQTLDVLGYNMNNLNKLQ